MKCINNRRVLVVDDQEIVHYSFRDVFGDTDKGTDPADNFDFEFATSGEEAVDKVRAAVNRDQPFAVAFVDTYMPQGIDGVETVLRLWEIASDLQVVLCTAFTDYSWAQVVQRLGQTDRLLILKKPFDKVEVRQLMRALAEKWRLDRQAQITLQGLEDMVAARTTALEQANARLVELNRQVIAARDAADAANRAKSDFLANMSHEIRTPMTAILGYADLLMDDEGPLDERRRIIEVIRRNGRHLLEIINDILDISRIEAGKLSIHRARCSPREIAVEVASLLNVKAEQKRIKLTVEFSGAVPQTIWCDPMRLRQILVNIAGNAVKFTDQGEVRLRVCMAPPEALPEPAVCFDVADTGIGMTAEQIGRLFQNFAQVDSSMTRRHGGTGLGLAISRRLAELMGGTISVTSVPAEGSTFRLLLPAGPIDESEPHHASAPAATRSPAAVTASMSPRQGTQGRILVAEDSADVQQLLASIVSRAGYETAVATSGQMAVDKALAAWREERPFDVILMDTGLPVLDGCAATRTLRSAGYSGRLIAVSARAMPEDRERSLAAGCDAFVAKPVDRDCLLDTIFELLHSAPAATPA